jgi:hypothetical protein
MFGTSGMGIGGVDVIELIAHEYTHPSPGA